VRTDLEYPFDEFTKPEVLDEAAQVITLEAELAAKVVGKGKQKKTTLSQAASCLSLPHLGWLTGLELGSTLNHESCLSSANTYLTRGDAN
jgi:hypothetical protein